MKEYSADYVSVIVTNERILIIDDNSSNVKLARLLLEGAGYEVGSASNSSEALETLRSFHPKLILMDIQLPGMDGLQLTRLLKEDPAMKNCIILAVTAYAMRGDEERARAAGCDGYLSKPIDTRTFVGKIRQYLEPRPEQASGNQPGGDPSDLLREFRNQFVAAAVESSRHYAEANLSSNDIDALRRLVHHWVGMGETLGFPEVTAQARQLESLLECLPSHWQQEASAKFQAMLALFSTAVVSGEVPTVPSALVESLASKQIGLIGFSENETRRVRAAFDQVHAVTRDLGALFQGLGMEALQPHDLIVLNACTEEGIRSWDSVVAQPLLQKPTLLVASRSALVDSKLALLDREVDFVAEPWDAEELLCRAQRAIGQKRGAQPARLETNRKPLVLIADDDPMVQGLLIPMLNKAGVDCLSAHDGREALEAVSRLAPDVLVLDIVMPRLSGITVLKEIRSTQKNHKVQIMILSVRHQKSDLSLALAFGANDYAVKPFDPADVLTRVMRLLPQRAARVVDEP